MYDEYINYLKGVDYTTFSMQPFKSHPVYCGILEHVSYDLGLQYLSLIEQEYKLEKEVIRDFIRINDIYGSPKRFTYTFNTGETFQSSPSSLRYIYHALLILDHYKTSGCKNIVEVGCGYGGLCLAMNYFSKYMNIHIGTYNFVDLPEVCTLIKNYLSLHNIYTQTTFHSSETYGAHVYSRDLFFISNYCYTEIDILKNKMYTSTLLPKASHGFLIWQNGGNQGSYPITDAAEILGKEILHMEEEKPQTDAGYDRYFNYFVYF